MSSYTANELNQYTQRTVPGYAGVRGSATNTATVTVNGNAAWRLDDYFYGGDDADNSLAAVMKELEVTAVVNPPGTNTPDLVESVTGRVYVAQSPETFTYDDDGSAPSEARRFLRGGSPRRVRISHPLVPSVGTMEEESNPNEVV